MNVIAVKLLKEGILRDSALDILRLIEGICIGLAAIGGGVAIIVKCIKSINEQHDRKEKYDAYDGRINELSNKIDDLEKRHDKKFEDAHFSAKQEINTIRTDMKNLLEEYQTQNDAKLQQISSELCMLSYCVGATLDGLKQLNCNGKVSEAKEKMDKHLNQQAHGEL